MEFTPLAQRAASYLLQKQLPDGGWSMYPGGRVEISGSVKAYFALKLVGHDPSAEYMQRARRAILAHGGADAVNSFTRFYLALLGQISYNQCPAVPPEMVWPQWFPVNLYAVSAWSRTIIVPLSIVSALQPVRRIEAGRGIRELFLREPADWPPLRCPGLTGGTGPLSWDRFFRVVEGALKWCQRLRLVPLPPPRHGRRRAWMLERFQQSDGLGAIYPPIVFSIVALRALGYSDESADAILHEAASRPGDRRRDGGHGPAATVQVARLGHGHCPAGVAAKRRRGGQAGHPPRRSLALGQADPRPGDWSQTVAAEPGGWAFEHANEFYPDSDDTAMVLMALRMQFADQAEPSAALPPEWRLSASTDGPGSRDG